MQHMSSETPAQGVQQLARHLSHDGGWTDPVDDPRSIGSKFGEEPRRTLETVGASLTIDDPSQIPVANGSRTWSVGFSLANAIWALRDSRSASDILPYNPKGSAFVEGGNFDAALGSRIASAYSDPIALRSIVNLLRSHPQSRRAYVPTILPLDLVEQPLDFPCAAGSHYLVRDAALHAVTLMRSQSVVGLLGYDLSLFTILQQVVAAELGLRLGRHTYFVSSLHCYEGEEDVLTAIAEGESQSAEVFSGPLSATPISCSKILEIEAQARMDCDVSLDTVSARLDQCPKEWQLVMLILYARLQKVISPRKHTPVVEGESDLYGIIEGMTGLPYEWI